MQSELQREGWEFRERHYAFVAPSTCNMCGNDAGDAEILGLRLDKSQGRRPKEQRGIAVSVCRCRSCGLIFSYPQPRPRSLSDHYGIPPESYWRTVSIDTPHGYFGREVATAKRLLSFRPGMRALDIGVGLGHAVQTMQSAGFEVSGIEPSEPFLAKAKERLRIDEHHLLLAGIEEAEFESESFDFVTFGAVIEHLYDPNAAICRALQWLKPGGVIQMEVPHAEYFISRLINLYYRVRGTNYVTNLSPMHVPFHLYEFTLESFRKNALLNGYTTVEHWFEVGSIYHVPACMHLPLRWWMQRSQTGMQLTVWLRKPAA